MFWSEAEARVSLHKHKQFCAHSAVCPKAIISSVTVPTPSVSLFALVVIGANKGIKNRNNAKAVIYGK